MGTNRIEEYNKIQKDLFERMSKDFEVGLNNVKTVAGVDLDTATIMTINMIDENSRIPIPTRLADLMTHKMRKKHILL